MAGPCLPLLGEAHGADPSMAEQLGGHIESQASRLRWALLAEEMVSGRRVGLAMGGPALASSLRTLADGSGGARNLARPGTVVRGVEVQHPPGRQQARRGRGWQDSRCVELLDTHAHVELRMLNDEHLTGLEQHYERREQPALGVGVGRR